MYGKCRLLLRLGAQVLLSGFCAAGSVFFLGRIGRWMMTLRESIVMKLSLG